AAAGSAAAGAERARIAARLEALAARWAATGPGEADGVDLDSASDDELFRIIDNELQP
ncbi:MAG: beta-ketoacyl synthase, partial [Streptomycetaceae bacterium]|nr:beta-ketoacyl synthase [Streptomycetaceae bacterium]